ncbi:MAG: HlyD family efflux transporter periplasmic adaptor subunit [Phycisphaerales bacterium]|nr:HlyD family efflux transporter periplasmic adaptor subunit [Phycisphaerales bacterium]MCB9862475.1 HlyD family efflux transporter periplasmic adaptor subunit [Phycisphaerales bacterium]
MKTMSTIWRMLTMAGVCVATSLAAAGCRNDDPAGSHKSDADAASAHAADAPTNRIDIPPSVRQNLGITFVKVERRPVRSTIRIPGQYELRPEARRDYHVMLPGRIELLVTRHQPVTKGSPLFYLDSPGWINLQKELVASLNTMKRSHADLAVAEANLNEAKQSIEFMEHRLANFAKANMRQVELEAQLADKRNAIPRLEAELGAARVGFSAAHSSYEVMLNSAASFAGVSAEELDPDEADEGHAHLADREPPWRSLRRLTIRAEADGVVDRLPITNRGWVETGDLVLDTVQPTMLCFHAEALQTDIGKFRNEQTARVVPPPGGSFDLSDYAEGHIHLGVEAHPDRRTISILHLAESNPKWARAGMTAYLEVFTDGSVAPVNAIPESAVVRDGLSRVFFRRDPKNPDVVIRIDADLGASDGRWVEVKSGVRAGDDIVLGGVYPLMLASSSSGTRQAGGHFHPDGTFHAGNDDK